jgi:hypothetical protein
MSNIVKTKDGQYSDSDIKAIMASAIGDGLVYKIISNKKKYKIYADGEITGFGKNAQIYHDNYSRVMRRFVASLKVIQNLQASNIMAQERAIPQGVDYEIRTNTQFKKL